MQPNTQQPSQESFPDQYKQLLQQGVEQGLDRDTADSEARRKLGLKETNRDKLMAEQRQEKLAEEFRAQTEKALEADTETPEPIVLNPETIANTLRDVFGEELGLSEQEVNILNRSYEDDKDVIQKTKTWPDLEQLLDRKKKESNANLDVRETEERILTALAA